MTSVRQSAPTLRFLVVEDEPIIVLQLAQVIEGLGHSVAGEAATLQEAHAALDSGRPDVVVSDVRLQDGSKGSDLLDRVLEETGGPMVFVTAFPQTLLTQAADERVFLLPKPFSALQARAVLQAAAALAAGR